MKMRPKRKGSSAIVCRYLPPKPAPYALCVSCFRSAFSSYHVSPPSAVRRRPDASTLA